MCSFGMLILFAITHLKTAVGAGYVLLNDNSTYEPLDFCTVIQGYGFYWTCYNQQLYAQAYSQPSCDDPAYRMYNLTETSIKTYDCDPNGEYTEYIQYSLYDLNINGHLQCSSIDSSNPPNNYAQIINKCVYEPLYGLYKMDTCTDTIWSRFRYSDPNCKSANIIHTGQIIDECQDNSVYADFTLCTQKMNDIGDKFGYFQQNKDSVLRPLNQCIIESQATSYLFTCVDNSLYMFYWLKNSCGNLTTADDSSQYTAFSFSCSSTTANIGIINVYSNDNNCTQLESNTNYMSKFPLVVDECFNIFDYDNKMVSTEWKCNDNSLWRIYYDEPNCDNQSNYWIDTYYTEDCMHAQSQYYRIDCVPIQTPTASPTQQPITTVDPTSKPTLDVTPSPTDRFERIFYVTDYGRDNVDCFYGGDCGTLKYASYAADFTFADGNISRVEIIVRGQNPEEIKAYIAANGTNPCIPKHFSNFWSYVTYSNEMTITFDPNYIKSMEDWYNHELCENFTQSEERLEPIGFFSGDSSIYYTLTVNNLIIDSYSFYGNNKQPYYISNLDTFICDNCQFTNIIIDSSHRRDDFAISDEYRSTLIQTAHGHFTGCTFENITYDASSSTVDSYGYDYSFILIDTAFYDVEDTHSFSLSLTHNTIKNIKGLSSFVYFVLTTDNGDLDVLIDNSKFEVIFVIDAILHSENNIIWISSKTFTISNTAFLNINSGSIFRSFHGKFLITISNVQITTSQTIQQYLEYRDLIERESDDYYSLFVFDSSGDTINIDNVTVTYLYGHFIEEYCQDIYGGTYESVVAWSWIEAGLNYTLDFILATHLCDLPIQFVDNVGVLNINQLSASNDITDTIIKEYTAYIEIYLETFSGFAGRDIYIDLFYNRSFEYTAALIYNHDDGELSIDGLYIYGLGVHETIILNPDGDLIINDMIAIPDTYCVNYTNGCDYDADALGIEYWIRFNGAGSNCNDGELRITNSYLFGCQAYALVLGSGSIYIENITVKMAIIGLAAGPGVSNLAILSSNFSDLGTYYVGNSVFLYWSDDYRPILIGAEETFIKNSVFSFVDRYQFAFTDKEVGWEDFIQDRAYDLQIISLINNKFEINDENVLRKYPSHQTLIYLNDWNVLGGADIDAGQETVLQYFVNDGAMVIGNDIQVTMINNEFSVNKNNVYVNESTLIEYGMAWISIEQGNDTAATICMSGNTFTNFAIWIKEGNVTSCVRKDMLNYIGADDCQYGTFGSIYSSEFIYNQGKSNMFSINYKYLESIIRTEDDTVIALDNNIINAPVDNLDILTIEQGYILLVNTFINGSDDYNIFVDDACTINCYTILDNDASWLPIIDIGCEDYVISTSGNLSLIHNLYQAKLVGAISPILITVFPNDSYYFPSGKLILDYFITDAYGQQIDELGQNLVIHFESISDTEAFSFQISIDSDGTCVGCGSGISFPDITLNDVGKEILFQGSVVDNSLFADGLLNITIIECPSGYGSNTALQCDLCARGYFNLLASNDSCHYCSNLNGVECPGADSIIVDYNYWIMVYQYGENVQENNGLFGNDEYIISIRCPNNYCCSLQDGCDFVGDTDKLCAKNRDPNEYLCGKCIEGYSEVYGTTNCAKCKRNFIERLLYPVLYGFLWTMFILFTKSHKTTKIDEDLEDKSTNCCNNKCCRCKKKKNDKEDYDQVKPKLSYIEYKESLEKMVTKVILYFYQSVGYILTTNGIKSSLYGFVELFNLNIFTTLSWGSDNDTNDGFCLLKDMTAPTKLAIQLTSSASIFCFIFLFYVLNSVLSNTVCKSQKRKVNYPRAFISASLICVGQILSILFQLLACRKIGKNKTAHYFFGSEECYGVIWIGAFVSLLLVIILFAVLFVFIALHRSKIQDKERRERLKTQKQLYYHSIVESYKDNYWYWELILFGRRLIFAFVFIVFDDNTLKICMGILLVIYSFIHQEHLPFKWRNVNRLDSYLIGCFVIIIFMSAIVLDVDDTFYDVIISTIILFPIIWFCWFLIANCKSFKHRGEQNDDKLDEDMDEIELAPRENLPKDTPKFHTIQTLSRSNVLNNGDYESSD